MGMIVAPPNSAALDAAISSGAAIFTQRARKTVTFTGLAGVGAVGTVALFTVSGLIYIKRIIVRCTTDLTGAAATLAVGTASDVDAFIAATVGTVTDAAMILGNTTPVVGTASLGDSGAVGATTAMVEKATSESIIATVGTADVTGGVLEFNITWEPESSGATLVAA